ncbi:MAG TPA: SDR family oxidoreductase [Gemmatimonadaceae bacterium]|nr:SDR family oxidoreductase [Gemmatimonadaceae bacterium]
MDILDFHAAHGDGVVLVTGATGLLGADVVKRWTTCGAPRRLAVLVRDRTRWETLARHAGLAPGAVVAIEGDIAIEGLGLAAGARAWLASRTTAMVHLAADTTFSRPLDQARRVNRDGTAHLLALAADCPHVERFTYVSTAFVAGRRTGFVPESAEGAATEAIGWVNAYERSKAEAEALVRAARNDWVILRSSTIACDDRSGAVTQRNAVHQALRLFHDGLAAMIPGLPDSVLDVVPTDYVSDAIARLALRGGIDGATVHLCAGAGAMPLGELLDECHARWAMDPVWRRRGIELPSQADLETWELFTQAVEETGHPRLRRVTRALTHFLPQLALPKCFDTRVADALLGAGPPPVREYWGHMLDHLQRTAWRGVPGLVEVAA